MGSGFLCSLLGMGEINILEFQSYCRYDASRCAVVTGVP